MENNEELEFYSGQGDGWCYKCKRGYSECKCSRFTLADAIANLGAELAMATNAMPERRREGVLSAFHDLEQMVLEYGDPLTGDDYQAMQDIRANMPGESGVEPMNKPNNLDAAISYITSLETQLGIEPKSPAADVKIHCDR